MGKSAGPRKAHFWQIIRRSQAALEWGRVYGCPKGAEMGSHSMGRLSGTKGTGFLAGASSNLCARIHSDSLSWKHPNLSLTRCCTMLRGLCGLLLRRGGPVGPASCACSRRSFLAQLCSPFKNAAVPRMCLFQPVFLSVL